LIALMIDVRCDRQQLSCCRSPSHGHDKDQ